MQHVGIAVALQELAQGSTRDTGLVGTVHHNLVLFVKRGECLPHSGEVDGTRNALGLEGPLTQSHHQAEVLLAVQLLLQFLAANCSHHILLCQEAWDPTPVCADEGGRLIKRPMTSTSRAATASPATRRRMR